MKFRRVLPLSALAAALAAPFPAPAQWADRSQQIQWPDPVLTQPSPKAKAPQRAQAPQPDVEELTPGQIRRAQEASEPAVGAAKKAATPKPKPKPAVARAVACSGAFAKNSNHIRLAQVFGSQNLTFAEVDGPENTKLMASVLFPKDPRRRLEVLWANEAARSDTSLIVINGKSAWTAPKGLRLGMPLATIEKLNRKPFKLGSFAGNGSTVLDWQGGALSVLPGGCKVGMRLAMNARAPDGARKQVASKKELVSSDAGVRALRPAVVEILLGY
jgi:hypothetical protein